MKQVHKEIEKASQVLINNGFSEKNIVRLTKNIIDKWHSASSSKDIRKIDISIFYCAFFHTAYKEEERIITQIARGDVGPIDTERKINIQIF